MQRVKSYSNICMLAGA